MPVVESTIPLVVAAIIGMFAAAGAANMPVTEPTSIIVMTVMDDERMRMMCLAGSLAGSVMSIIFFKLQCVKDMARKMIGSGIAGFVFAPMVLRWLGWTRDLDLILGVSAGTALLSWTLLQWLVPLTPKLGTWFLTKFLGIPPSEPTDTTKLKP